MFFLIIIRELRYLLDNKNFFIGWPTSAKAAYKQKPIGKPLQKGPRVQNVGQNKRRAPHKITPML